MKKKGQITVFVVIGIIILTVVIITLYMFQTSISSKKAAPFETIPPAVLNVEKYVTSCLNDALESAAAYCSGHFQTGDPKCPNYEEDIAERAREDFCNCIPECTDFSMFPDVEVEIKEDLNIKAILTGKKGIVKIIMEYPILVKKRGDEYFFGTTESPFFAQHTLKQSSCVPIITDGNCIAQESKTVEVLGILFTFNPGQKVAIGANCIAC
ncbi:MAG: hypothetical protein ISS23_02645 [Nanoarchaeota archaeon]|nr:hypothetical protein [Nanoarchaeota archaeon]